MRPSSPGDSALSTQHSALVYLGLGSNLGNRAAHLGVALAGLGAAGVAARRRSPLYETAPVGPPDQPWFLNAVLEAETRLDPTALLAAAKAVEGAAGRQPGPRWGPRAIDVDILLYDDRRIDQPDPWLTIPHPELWRRLFVLVPLRDLRPDLRGPDGRPIDAWIADLEPGQALRRAALSWPLPALP